MNKLYLIGNVTKDVETRDVNGKKVCTFTLAVDRKRVKDVTDFFRIDAWGKLAEAVANNCGKGSKVAVEAILMDNTYEKDGQRVFSLKIVAQEVEFLNLKKPGTSTQALEPEPAVAE